MMCDLCGKTIERVWKTLIEGVSMDVCESCTHYGRMLKQPSPAHIPQHVPPSRVTERSEQEEMLIPEYGVIIKRARESRKLNQEDFAKLINEKLSVIQKVERGEFEPPLHVARKWEKTLGIKLVETNQNATTTPNTAEKRQNASRLTLSDFITKKK